MHPRSTDAPLSSPSRRELAPDELLRYSRHFRLGEVGVDGQRRLAAASALVVGAGGLGSPAALYLAAAGVGRIGIIDHDRVELSNLQRQVLHDTPSVGERKVESARRRLAALNPHVRVDALDVELTSANALEIIGAYDIVVDGSDNFRTRYLTSDACVLLGRPNVHGSVSRFEGQATVLVAGDAPCYRCLFPDPPAPGTVPSCDEAGVLGVLPGLVGMVQATEAVKLLLGIGETLAGRLLLVDAMHMRFRTVRLERDPRCPACGTRELTALADYDALCGTPGAPDGAGAAEPNDHGSVGEDDGGGVREIAPARLADRLRAADPPLLVDVREPYEWRIARIEGARLIPMSALASEMSSLDPEREIVLYCHHGMRSLAAAEHLAAHGFRRVRNLSGGIDRWSTEVDADVPRY
jgi:adenylyltransferase/sulfurtransferase